MEQEQAKREPWIDFLKLLAVLLVYITHFISEYNSEYFVFWDKYLYGLSGKFGVALLGVLVGYFATKSKDTDVTHYVVKRYLYFVLSGLMINTLLSIFMTTGIISYSFEATGVPEIILITLEDSLLLGDTISHGSWFMLPFFVSSVLAYINSRAKSSIVVILIQIIVFILIGQIWISICLIGCIVSILHEKKAMISFFSKTITRILFLIIAAVIIIRPESFLTFLLDGISAGIIVLVIGNSPLLQKLLSSRFISVQGKNTMAIFLIHVVVYSLLGGYLFKVLPMGNYNVVFILIMLLCWIVTVLLSFPITKMLNAELRVLMSKIEELKESVMHRKI